MPWPPAQPLRGLAMSRRCDVGRLRPLPEKSATSSALIFSAQQVADAKSKVCAAYTKIHHAVDVNAPRRGGDDPTLNSLLR